MKTHSAIEIMNRRFGNDAETQARLADERVKSLAALAIYNARTAAGLTQQQLAALIDTKQPVIARLEDADYEGHTTAMLNRIATALNQRLELRFVPTQTQESVTFADASQSETRTLLASLIAEVRGLNTQMRDVQKELSFVKAEVLNTCSEEPVGPSAYKLCQMDTERRIPRTLKPNYGELEYSTPSENIYETAS